MTDEVGRFWADVRRTEARSAIDRETFELDILAAHRPIILRGQAISLVDCEKPDFERHPKFKDALAAAELAVLEPGDVLYLPPLWWHYVASPSPMGAQVNFWWEDSDASRLGPTDTLLHAMLTLRGLSPQERAGWRNIFDYYIFDSSVHDMSHIPASGRGVLGDMSEAERAQLRKYLAEQLGRKT